MTTRQISTLPVTNISHNSHTEPALNTSTPILLSVSTAEGDFVTSATSSLRSTSTSACNESFALSESRWDVYEKSRVSETAGRLPVQYEPVPSIRGGPPTNAQDEVSPTSKSPGSSFSSSSSFPSLSFHTFSPSSASFRSYAGLESNIAGSQDKSSFRLSQTNFSSEFLKAKSPSTRNPTPLSTTSFVKNLNSTPTSVTSPPKSDTGHFPDTQDINIEKLHHNDRPGSPAEGSFRTSSKTQRVTESSKHSRLPTIATTGVPTRTHSTSVSGSLFDHYPHIDQFAVSHTSKLASESKTSRATHRTGPRTGATLMQDTNAAEYDGLKQNPGRRPSTEELPTTTKHRKSPHLTSSSIEFEFEFQHFAPLAALPSQQCDPYGPLCQQGTITVGMTNASTVKTTAIPCSSYLSAQAQYVQSDKLAHTSWWRAFGRSDQCTALADSFHKARLHSSEPAYLSSCHDDSQTTTATTQRQILPPAVHWDWVGNGTMRCCGPCAIFIPRVRLAYFPPEPRLPCKNFVRDVQESVMTSAPNTKPESRGNAMISDGFTLYVLAFVHRYNLAK